MYEYQYESVKTFRSLEREKYNNSPNNKYFYTEANTYRESAESKNGQPSLKLTPGIHSALPSQRKPTLGRLAIQTKEQAK